MEIAYKSVTGENIKVVVAGEFEGVIMQINKSFWECINLLEFSKCFSLSFLIYSSLFYCGALL